MKIFTFLLLAATALAQTLPSEADLRLILRDRAIKNNQTLGIVAGIVSPAGRRVVGVGVLETGDTRPINGDTVFEVGSVTEVFTSLLLADMVQRHEVALTDPVSKYLPATVKMPQRNGKEITLADLATHTSGLPRLPANLKPQDLNNPYAAYTVAQLYDFLSSYQLTRDIGSKYEYSNLGGGLLGHVLALRAGMSYADLVRVRVLAPLGMKDTAITLTPAMKARLALGHDGNFKTVPNWDMPTLAGAGSLRSTVNDMLTFLAANIGLTKTALAPAMAATLAVRRPSGTPGMDVALAWSVVKRDGEELVLQDGGTGGYRSIIGYDAKTRTGVVVLSNTATPEGIDDIALHLLDAKSPLLPDSAFQPPPERNAIAVDPKLFDGFVGRYQLTPTVIVAISRDGDHLFLELPGQPKAELFAEGPKDYFIKQADLQVTFYTDDQGKAASLTIHAGGQNPQAKRVN